MIPRSLLRASFIWNQTVYSTTTYDYNGRDQIREINHQGQLRTFEYDGHGRLWKRTTPEQGTVEFSYNRDDTPAWMKDARGVTAIYGHTARHLLETVTYDLSGVAAGQGVAATPNVTSTFTNNRKDGWVYDLAGNLKTAAGVHHFSYDATGRQVSASTSGIQNAYDGDMLRAKRVQGGVTTYYLRSAALGGQVVAEVGQVAGQWTSTRGYVYLGGNLLAVKEGGATRFSHDNPVTKDRKLTDAAGAVASAVVTDPFGGENSTGGWNFNTTQQPRKFTTYDRDADASDEAGHRRYRSSWGRFDQPDPYEGSYDYTDPQSFNRYAYVGSDPVNLIDPAGLQSVAVCGAEYSFSDCGGGGGFWGDNFGPHVAEYDHDFAGLTPHVAAALAEHHDRIQNTLDALDARRALAAEDWELLTIILLSNPTLEVLATGSEVASLGGVHIYDPVNYQWRPARRVPRRTPGAPPTLRPAAAGSRPAAPPTPLHPPATLGPTL